MTMWQMVVLRKQPGLTTTATVGDLDGDAHAL